MPGAYPKSILLGLLGAPIAHSASPAMHEAAAKALGLRCFYHLIEVAGADDAKLASCWKASALWDLPASM
jgi:shikimate dehydrogenase